MSHCSNSYMQPIATDEIAWSLCVCLSVGHDSGGSNEPAGVQIPKEKAILKSTASHCFSKCSKKSITASSRLLQPTTLLPTGLCHINSSREKSDPAPGVAGDAASRRNSLTTCRSMFYSAFSLHILLLIAELMSKFR